MRYLLLLLFCPTLAFAAQQQPTCTNQGTALPFQPMTGVEVIQTPPNNDPRQGHARWISQINGCGKFIHMEMFHLTDPKAIEALENAAVRLNPKNLKTDGDGNVVGGAVQIILDRDFYEASKNKPIIDGLRAKGVAVRPGSAEFSITHAKTMNCDGKTLFITAMNLTGTENRTRDFGVITSDAASLAQHETVFQSDWANSPKTGIPLDQITPGANSKDAIVWSPGLSKPKLLALLCSAKPGTTLICSTESLTDDDVIQALAFASNNGVDVRFLAPQCDENPCPLLNIPYMQKLNKLTNGKAIARVMPPGAPDKPLPYIHSKMCMVNFDPKTGAGGVAFVGSENASRNSLDKARELGVVFKNDPGGKMIWRAFQSDWSNAISPDVPPTACPAPAPGVTCDESGGDGAIKAGGHHTLITPPPPGAGLPASQ